MTQFSENILGKIKQEHIAPVPRWHFLLKSYVFWTILAISVLLGSLSFSVVVHILNFGDLNIFNQVHGNLLSSTIMMLPFFWLLFVFLFALIAYYNWKHTKLGYRFKRRWIVSGSVLSSILFGSVLYSFGMGNEVDILMAQAMPFYDQSRHDVRVKIWMQPEAGFLVGKVISVDDVESNIIIKDEIGKKWSVSKKNISQEIKTNFEKGKIIKIIGKKDGEHEFVAKEIRRCGDCEHDERIGEIEKDDDKDDSIIDKKDDDNHEKN